MPTKVESQLRWSYFSTFSTAGMQLLAAATITRFLQPKDYGISAMAMLCASLAGYFTQLGMSRAIVQKPVLTAGNIKAAFALSLVTGLSGSLVLCAIAPLLAIYFREPRLSRIVVVFSLNLIFLSLSMVSGGLLRREFRIRDVAICDFLGYSLSTFGFGLPLAIKGFGVWALVASNVSQPIIVATAYFIACPHSVVPTFAKADYKHITAFGTKATVTTAVEAIGYSLDTILLGRFVPPSSLGIYNRSLTLSTVPMSNLAQGIARVFYPTIARSITKSLKECHQLLQASELQLLALVIPSCIGAAVAAPTLIPVIFGKQWSSAVPLYQAMCAVAAFDVTTQLPCIQLEVLNRFRQKLIVQFTFATALGLVVFAMARYGVTVVAFSLAALHFVRAIALHQISARSLGTSIWSLLKTWGPGIYCGVIVGFGLYLLELAVRCLPQISSPLRLLILVVAGIAIGVAVYRFAYRQTVYEAWKGLFKSNAHSGDVDLS